MTALDKNSAILTLAIIVAGMTAYYVFSKNGKVEPNNSLESVASIKVVGGTEMYTENTNPELKATKLADKTAVSITPIEEVVDRGEFNDLQLVNKGNAVDGARLVALMSGTGFDAAVSKLEYVPNKTLETVKFENGLSEYIHSYKLNSHFTDYKVGCDNKICLAYFVSPTKEDLDLFAADFTNGNESPMHKSGFVNFVINEVDNGFEYRVSFNSDPSVNSITFPN
ncbi:hypothetical protein [Shewanella acanthi]|uniref:hypothetical protein n=1 Tax=Shewanella acanthi TaxID=2864212 RepID=UPI001C660DB2|nr:hypothetical protein [Shewanella acanthi]QYJ80467.1 hypothetical protein K0H61_08935 [Shewanella acanthi]